MGKTFQWTEATGGQEKLGCNFKDMLQSCRLLNSIVRRKLVCSAALILICFLLYLRFSHPHLGKLRIPLFVGGKASKLFKQKHPKNHWTLQKWGFWPCFFRRIFLDLQSPRSDKSPEFIGEISYSDFWGRQLSTGRVEFCPTPMNTVGKHKSGCWNKKCPILRM